MIDKESKKLERQHMRKINRNTYIALEELNHNWDLKDVHEFQRLWDSGISIIELSAHFGRSQEELGVLILDRALKDKIKPRKGGLFGNEM